MERPKSPIPKHTLDVIHMLMKAKRIQFRYLGAYVRAKGDRVVAEGLIEQEMSGPQIQPMSLSPDDECPEGFHLENGVCVPD
jgi:hypothetical protein